MCECVRIYIYNYLFYLCRNSLADSSHKDKTPDLSIQQLQEAIVNFAVVLHALWPSDYSALVILRVLVEAKWGEVAGNDNKKRCKLVREFFNDIHKSNSGRAIHRQHPLEYEQVHILIKKDIFLRLFNKRGTRCSFYYFYLSGITPD